MEREPGYITTTGSMDPRRRGDDRCESADGGQWLCGVAAHTTIITGFSISRLNAPISSAPSAPSTAR